MRISPAALSLSHAVCGRPAAVAVSFEQRQCSAAHGRTQLRRLAQVHPRQLDVAEGCVAAAGGVEQAGARFARRSVRLVAQSQLEQLQRSHALTDRVQRGAVLQHLLRGGSGCVSVGGVTSQPAKRSSRSLRSCPAGRQQQRHRGGAACAAARAWTAARGGRGGRRRDRAGGGRRAGSGARRPGERAARRVRVGHACERRKKHARAGWCSGAHPAQASKRARSVGGARRHV